MSQSGTLIYKLKFNALLGLIFSIQVGLLGCQKTQDQKGSIGNSNSFSTTKTTATSVSASHLSERLLRELSRLDRPLKAFMQIGSSPINDCRTFDSVASGPKSDGTHKIVYHWSCHTSPQEVARRQIKGQEILSYQASSGKMEYTANFEFRFFKKDEPEAQADFEQIRRKVSISHLPIATLLNPNSQIKGWLRGETLLTSSDGTNASFEFGGEFNVVNQILNFSLQGFGRDLQGNFTGNFFGEDGERKTQWFNGSGRMKSKKIISMNLSGICAHPEGSYEMTLEGAGLPLVTQIDSNSTGIIEGSGISLLWNARACNDP